MLVRYYTVDKDKDQETVFLPLRCDLTWLIWFQCLLGALQVAALLLTWSAVVNTSPQWWNIYRDQTVNSVDTLVLRPEAWQALQRDISSLSIAALSRLNFLQIIHSQSFTISHRFFSTSILTMWDNEMNVLRSVQYIIFCSISIGSWLYLVFSVCSACRLRPPSVSLAAQSSIHSIRWQKCRTYPTLLITALRIFAVAPHRSVHWLYLNTPE